MWTRLSRTYSRPPNYVSVNFAKIFLVYLLANTIKSKNTQKDLSLYAVVTIKNKHLASVQRRQNIHTNNNEVFLVAIAACIYQSLASMALIANR